MAIRKVKLPNGDTHDIGVRESEITWGDKDITSGYALGDVFLNDALRANRFAGLRAEGITIEHSHDNGATWSEYEATDLSKRNLFTSTASFLISGSSSVTATVSDQLRVTIDTGLGGIYSYLNKFHIYVSTNGSSGCTVTIDAAPSNDIDNFKTNICTDVSIAGWSGWNVIHIPFAFCTAYTSLSSSSQYRKIRFTFKHTGINTNYRGLQVLRIFSFGGVGYNTPSQMALNGHAYTFDGDMNVTFPAKVIATGGFIGNADTASLAVKSRALEGVDTRNTNQTPHWYISNYPYRMIKEFKSTSAIGVDSILSEWVYCELITDVYYADWSGGGPFQIAINKNKRAIRYAESQSAWGEWQDLSNASTVNNHTVDSDVPADAKFTDTIALESMTGTLPVTHGGTGKTNANDAANNLISGLPAWTANPADDTYFVRQDTGGTNTFGRVKFSTLWNYIKGKFSGTSPITFSNGAIGINTASTSGYGATKLSTATNSTAVDVAATPSAVKTAYDLANSANTTANTALSGVNGNLIYDQTFTISNGVATFTPHVYQKGQEVTTNYAKSCFVWKYRLIDGSEVSLTTNNDRGCTVTISGMGYGGHVIGAFTPS